MVLPQTRCRTFGVRVFIRVPSPAARMMTAAGSLALTRLLGIGAGTRRAAPPAGSRSGLPQDTAWLAGRHAATTGLPVPRRATDRSPIRQRRPGCLPAVTAGIRGTGGLCSFCQHLELLFDYGPECRL